VTLFCVQDELVEMVNNSGEAQNLFDGLHKTYHYVEELDVGYKGPGRGQGKSRGRLKRQKV
jgi:hypothetical protein